MVWILLPASSRIPEPWFIIEDNGTIDEAAGIEDEPPATFTELGESGGHVSSPPVSEPSLYLVR